MQLLATGHDVLGHGTDNHTLWLNVGSQGLTGVVAEHALEACGVYVSRNRVPFDVKPPQVASGIRLGTTVLTQRGMTPADMSQCARVVVRVLAGITPQSDTEYQFPDDVRQQLQAAVAMLCRQFPLPVYDFDTPASTPFRVVA